MTDEKMLREDEAMSKETALDMENAQTFEKIALNPQIRRPIRLKMPRPKKNRILTRAKQADIMLTAAKKITKTKKTRKKKDR